MKNSALLKSLGNGQWLLNVILQVDDGAKLTMASSDVSWLKISKANGIVVYGKIDILGSKITSWELRKSASIQQTSSGSTPGPISIFVVVKVEKSAEQKLLILVIPQTANHGPLIYMEDGTLCVEPHYRCGQQ